MKKSLKTIVALTGISAFALGVGLMKQTNAVSVMAATSTAMDTGFYMETYAGVYDNDASGISFKTNITKSWYENVLTEYENANRLEFHTLVTRLDDGYTYEDMLYNDADGLVGTRALLDIESPFRIAEESFTDGENTLDVVCYAAAITYDLEESQLLSAYETELTARSYVLIKDETGTVLGHKYAEYNANTCSIKQVANLLILQGNDSANVAKYTNTTFTKVESGGYYLAKAKDGNVAIKVDTLNTVTDVVIDGNRVSADLWTQDGEEIQLGDLSSLDLTAGESYVLAAYDEAADTYYMADFTVPEAYGDAVWYSTADETLYGIQESKTGAENEETASILESATVMTVDGDSVDLANTANVVKTTENIMLTVNETVYEATINSYEKVITKASDLTYFKVATTITGVENGVPYYVRVKNDTTHTQVGIYVNNENGTPQYIGNHSTVCTQTNNVYYYDNQPITIVKTSNTYYQSKHFGGYYIVANNIDASNYELPSSNDYNYNSYSSEPAMHTNWVGLQGTFDGNGHIIDNLTFKAQHGIFGNVGQSGVIKEVAFTNVSFKSTQLNQGVLAAFFAGQLINSYLHAETLGNGVNKTGLVAGTLNNTAVLKTGTVLRVSNIGNSTQYYGVIAGELNNWTANTLKNVSNNMLCTVISDLDLINNANGICNTNTDAEVAEKTNYDLANVTRYNDVSTLCASDNYSSFKSSRAGNGNTNVKAMWTKIFADMESEIAAN